MNIQPFSKLILKNSFHLYSYQVSLYFFPLVTYPYLFRVLGVSYFGYISFVFAYFAYFNKVVEYSFNIYSVRDVSISDNKESSLVFSRVLFLKGILFLISLLILFSIYYLFLVSKIDIHSFLLSTGSLFALTFTPYWYYKGKQEMKFISIFNIVNKSLTLILILMFIKGQEDYINYFVIDFVTNMVVAIFVVFFTIKRYKIKLIVEPFEALYNYFKKGFMIFVSEMCAFIYSSSNILILGIFTDSTIVGYYSLSEKIINFSKGIFSPITQAAFPTLSTFTKESKKTAIDYIIKISRLMGVTGFVVSLSILIFSDTIIGLLIGYYNENAVYILRVLSPIIFSFSLAIVFSNLYLHSFGLFKLWNKLVIFTFVTSILLLLFLIIITKNYLNSVIFTTLFSEIILTIISIVIFYRNKSINT